MAGIIARQLLITFRRSWETEEDPEDWKVNVTSVLKNEDLGNP